MYSFGIRMSFVRLTFNCPLRDIANSQKKWLTCDPKENLMFKLCMILVVVVQGSIAYAVPFEGHEIVMSGPSPYAIDAGKEIALAGGNVVDVAVGMALTLSVTSP